MLRQNQRPTTAFLALFSLALVQGCGDDEAVAGPVCGNGVVEAGEDCDGSCPVSCDDGDGCTVDEGSVTPEACSVDCSYTAITVCETGDDCCPAGCTRYEDSDCPYYVDATLGDDGNDGITPETAWQTAARVSAEPLGPGDRVAFKRGEIWRESFALDASGSAEHPIVIQTYGAASEPPTFRPTQAVEGWTPEGSAVYAAPLVTEPVQVLVDGVRLAFARHPNEGYLYVDESEPAENMSSFVDADLSGVAGELVGATVLMRANRWDLGVGRVASFAAGRVTLDAPLSTGSGIGQNEGYVLTSKRWMVDGPGEWFYDAPSATLYVRLADESGPSGHDVEIATATSGIVSTAGHVVFDGLAVRGAGAHGIEIGSPDGVKVRNCHVEDAGHDGIFVNWPPGGAVVEIDDNTVLRANFTGIMVSADTETAQQVKLRRNRVEDTAPSFPVVSDASDAASYSWGFGMALHVYGHGVEVQGNTVLSAGYSCLALSGAAVVVSQNRLERCCLLFDDGGGIYMGGFGHVVRQNTVIDSLGNAEGTPSFFTNGHTAAQGIYPDDASHDIVIENNTVVNADFGIQLHNTQSDEVRGNVIYDCRNAGIHVSENGSTNPGFCRDNRVEQNVVVATRQVPAIVESYDMGWLVDYASYDDNRYWHEQGHKPFVRSVSGETSSYDVYSLDEWRAATGYDASSVDLGTSYQVVPLAGRPTGASSLMANGTFDSDVAGWAGWPEAVTVAWSADGGLDGGCLSASATGAGEGALVNSPAFSITEGRGYLLRFAVRSAAPQALSAVVRLNESPWSSLGLSALWSAGAEPSDYTLPFVGTLSAEGRLDFTGNDDFAFFLDDVDLREAEIFENEREDDFQILLNTTAEPQSFELGAATYCDLDEQELSGVVVVPAFGSLVLTSCQCNADAVCNNHETAASCAVDCP